MIEKIGLFSYQKSISYNQAKSCSLSDENGNRPQIAVLGIPRYLSPNTSNFPGEIEKRGDFLYLVRTHCQN